MKSSRDGRLRAMLRSPDKTTHSPSDARAGIHSSSAIWVSPNLSRWQTISWSLPKSALSPRARSGGRLLSTKTFNEPDGKGRLQIGGHVEKSLLKYHRGERRQRQTPRPCTPARPADA